MQSSVWRKIAFKLKCNCPPRRAVSGHARPSLLDQAETRRRRIAQRISMPEGEAFGLAAWTAIALSSNIIFSLGARWQLRKHFRPLVAERYTTAGIRRDWWKMSWPGKSGSPQALATMPAR